MRLINSLLGVVALRVAADEVIPLSGLIFEDMIKFIGNTYQFSVRPQIPPGIAPGAMQPFIFQSGAAVIGEEKFPIFHLGVLQNGDVISSATTEIADKIMDDYLARLDAQLKYRNASAKNKRKSYFSNVVFEFENSIGEKIEALRWIEELLMREIKRPTLPFKLKRLAFGSGPTPLQGLPTSLEMVENADFLIERRETEPYIENRYFSAAPITTSEHIRILELLEQELAA